MISPRRAAVLAALALPLACFAQDAERMDEVVRSFVDAGDFMGSVLVARGDDVLLDEGYGYANLEWGVPNTPTTKFRIGSITKALTAAAVLLLEERGALRIEDRIARYFPDAPAAWQGITLRHLLTHTSGLPDFNAFAEFESRAVPRPIDDVVAALYARPLEFAPGERMSYSNSGYLLLGRAVEIAGGVSYESFLRENVFAPLGMSGSGHDSQAAIVPERASGYARGPGPGGFVHAAFLDPIRPNASGGLYSTTEDLVRFTRALFGGRLLSSASLEKMTTPFHNRYALGVRVEPTPLGVTMIGHTGNIEGFTTSLAHYPEADLTVAVLGNVSGAAPIEIARLLALLALGEDVVLPRERTFISLSSDELERLVGVYALAQTGNAVVTASGEHLYVAIGVAAPTPLFAESPTRFHSELVGTIEFELDDAGAPTALVLKQIGREQRAVRLPDRVEIELPRERLAEYEGTYEIGPGLELTITLEGGRLIAWSNAWPPAQLYAEAVDRLFLKVSDVQLEFLRDEEGRVEAMMMRYAGQAVRAPRR